MSFEVVEFRPGRFGKPLPARHMSITGTGIASFHAADLQAAGIAGSAVVLVDEGLLRIGLRAPRSGEGKFAAPVRAPKKRGRSLAEKRSVNINCALRKLEFKAPEVAGRYELGTNDDDLAGVPEPKPAKGKRRCGPRRAERVTLSQRCLHPGPGRPAGALAQVAPVSVHHLRAAVRLATAQVQDVPGRRSANLRRHSPREGIQGLQTDAGASAKRFGHTWGVGRDALGAFRGDLGTGSPALTARAAGPENRDAGT